MDGHSHSIIGDGNGWICPETGTLVNQASCKGECVGVMKLYIKDGVVVEKTGEIVRLAEGGMAPVACLRDGSRGCERADDCLTLPLWEGLDQVVREYLDSISLASLLDNK